MNRVEFISACKLSLCGSKTAERYIAEHPKDDYTTDDVIAAYHSKGDPIQIHGRRIGNGYYADGTYSQGYTTKRYPRNDSGKYDQE